MTAKLEAIISKERLGTYFQAAAFDVDRALRLYVWNMKLSAAFLPLLCSAEICLRNLVSARLAAAFEPVWWRDPAFLLLLGGKGKGIVKRAEGKIIKHGNVVTSGRITAELSFGFWEGMLLEKYQAPLWAPLHPHFPDIPDQVDQAELHTKCGVVRELRNRISHHEPIFRRNISQDYSDCLTLIKWLSPEKAAWIKPHCQVASLIRQKP